MDFSLENMCRTCMNEEGTMFSVFTMENRGISKICYADMLMACASLHVDRNDDLPQKICQHCLKHLSIAYSFKQQSERSEATLREITKNPDIEFIKEEIFNDDTYADLDNFQDAEDINNTTENETQEDPTCTDDVQHEFKLTEDYLEDEYIADEELPEELDSFQEYATKHNFIKKENFEATDTEFLEDEFVLEDNEPNSTKNTNKEVSLESEEFLDDNVEVQEEINPKREKNKPIYDLATLRKAVLKPKSGPLSSPIISQINASLDLDCLRKSVLTPKSKPRREFKCSLCEQSFWSQPAFKKHKKLHSRKLKCELCLKEFRSSHGLRYHMKIHNGIKNYPCNFGNCTKRFRLKQALDKHLSIHNNEKNHLCSLCGKTYSTYDALHYHLKAHRGERPYLCIHCGKTFKQSCHLKSHMWVHSGIKPHVCSRCGKCYTSGHQLKKHVQKHCPPPPMVEAPQQNCVIIAATDISFS